MLAVDKLVAGYRSGPIAALPSFALAPGEAAVLLGPSGSGKTTLLLALAGLVTRYGGRATIDGVDPYALSQAKRDRFRGRQAGFVFQDLHLVVGLSALDNVLLAAFATGARQDTARARMLLTRLGLGDAADRRAERLSRGQAQRVALARAMLLKPRILLADEPTASLDDEACTAVTGLLVDAASETGAALVIASHDSRVKSQIARHITVEPVA